ncbi:hypothetical protein PENANT_c004G07175 [Penicillium antarcticum]|uniref:Uncharacterized protein n=1 Tax=Penicillium antarcticum TaxID=416450 RepID=A0A1V6QGU7_9EURO|nr:hypothetical protein PENANT_c004G07175 [Penicillium antarcticum]
MNGNNPEPSLMGFPAEMRLLIADILQAEDPPSIFNLAAVNRNLYIETNRYRFRDIQLNLVTRKKLAEDLWKEILQRNDAFSSVQRLTIQGFLPPIQDERVKKMTVVPWSSAEDRDNINELTSREEFNDQNFDGKPHWKPRPEYNAWPALPEFVYRLLGLKDLVWSSLTLFPPPLLNVLNKKFHQTNLTTCKLHILTYNLPRYVQQSEQRCDTNWYEYHLATSPCLSSIVLSVEQQRDVRRLSQDDKMMLYELATRLAPNLTKVNIMDVSSELPCRLNAVPRPIVSQSLKRNPLQGLSLNLRVLQLWQANEGTLQNAGSRDYPALSSLALQPNSEVEEELVRRFVCSLPLLNSLHLCGKYSEETFQAILDCHGQSLRKLCLVPVTLYDEFNYHRITLELLKLIRTHCPNIQDLRVPTIRSAGGREECDLYRALGEFPKVTNLTLELQQCDEIPDMDPGVFRDFVERDRRRELNIRQFFTKIAVDERFMSRQYVAFRCDGDRVVVREIGVKSRKIKEHESPCLLGAYFAERGYIGFFGVFPQPEVIKTKDQMTENEIERAIRNLKLDFASNSGGRWEDEPKERLIKEELIREFKRLHPGLYEWSEAHDAAEARKEEAKKRAAEQEKRRFNKWTRENPKAYQDYLRARREAKLKKKLEEKKAAKEAKEEAKRKAEAYARHMANPNRDWGDDSLDGKNTWNRWPVSNVPKLDPKMAGDWWNKWYSFPLTDLPPEKLYDSPY